MVYLMYAPLCVGKSRASAGQYIAFSIIVRTQNSIPQLKVTSFTIYIIIRFFCRSKEPPSRTISTWYCPGYRAILYLILPCNQGNIRHTVVCQWQRKTCSTDWSVLFTGTAKSQFSTPHISITTGLISIKFTYFMPSVYATLHTKFEENQICSLWDMRLWKLSDFLYTFFFFPSFYNNNFEPRKNTLFLDGFLLNLVH